MALGVCLLAIGPAVDCHAQQPKGRQHLVNPGDEWSQLAAQLRPGDEVILLPGVHRPAILEDLSGTAERPIVIRSLDTDNIAVINAAIGAAGAGGGRHGLLLRNMKYVVIRNVIVTGASVHGIEASGPNAQVPDADGRPPSLVLRNVRVERIGPIGRRNAVLLRNLDQVVIERCEFEGWGGSAIELVACNDVSIQNCSFKGLEDFSQMNAVQIRAGSQRVQVTNCIMIDSGVTGIAIGGTSELTEFRQRSDDSQRHEAGRVRVSDNLFRGGHSAVAFINCDQCSVRNNTIFRPQRWVYLVLDRKEPYLAATRRSVFASNLVRWEPGDIRQFSHLNEGVSSSGLVLEQNLWWSPDLAQRRSRMGEPAGSSQLPQVMDVDPKLDADFFPTEPLAAMFGRDTP